MRQEVMDIVLKATDNASPTFEAVEDAAEDLEESVDRIGVSDEFDSLSEELNALLDEVYDTEEGFDELGDGADKAKEDVDKLGKESDETKEKVKGMGDESKSSGATMQMAFQNIADGVMRAKEGVVELGRNLMETLELAGQQQQQETFLKMNIGAEGAAKQMKIINDLVADLPGDDVAIGGLLSQAAAKNAGITADELKRMGVNAADYFAAMSNYGKSSVEAQQDLTNYILTGNTAELERSPILQGHIDKLKQATTVEERNKALQEAMNEEGWAGISQQDTYNNKLETFVAMLDRGKRQMGELFLGAASGAMDFISQLDSATGGILGMGIAIGTVAGGPMIDLVTGVGQMATGLGALRTAFEGTAIATAIAEGGFWSMAAAELAALWPILAIIAALVAVGVAIYEVGKYFGWWSDVGTMLEAINAGVQRLWSAFINHPDVQGFIQGVSAAWKAMQPFLNTTISLILRFFNVSGKKDFDIVRTLINAISTAWRSMTAPIRLVISVIQAVWRAFETMYNRAKNAIDKTKTVIRSIVHVDISAVTGRLVKPFQDAYARIAKEVDKIKAKANQAGKAGMGILGQYVAGFDYEGMLAEMSSGNNYSVDSSLTLDHNINFKFDFTNLPEGTSEENLIAMLQSAITDRSVINSLVNSPDFQSLDGKVKERLVLKNGRARGV